MSNDGAEFTPEQVEHQIDMLVQSQEPWPDPSSDTRLIFELYQVYTEDDATVENVWQRLAERARITSPRSVARNVTHQRRSRTNIRPEWQEKPQRMKSNAIEKRPPATILRFLELCAALLLVAVLGGSMAILISSVHQKQTLGSIHKGVTAIATPARTILFSDPLNINIHHWPVASNGSEQHFFKDGAYHIINQTRTAAAIVVYPQNFPETALSYQITMKEIAGNDTSFDNAFGIILNYNKSTVRGVMVETFYSFEIHNDGSSSRYSFYKYDMSDLHSPWRLVGRSINTGKEFHGGSGAQAMNRIKVVEKGSAFTFYVNGQQVGIANDGSLKPGSVGMLLNLTGTEVAFSNMLITHP